MSIEVNQISHDVIMVNNKQVVFVDDKWISQSEFSTREKEAFDDFIKAKKRDKIKVEFEDKGQDLLYFVIDNVKRIVIEAGPYHNNLYKGSIILNKTIEEGGFISYKNPDSMGTIKYPIVKKSYV